MAHEDWSDLEIDAIVADYFIAEQIGVPTFYHELEQWSDGPAKDDHCWHEFSDFVEHSQLDPTGKNLWGTSLQLVERFRSIKEWNEISSSNFEIGGCFSARSIRRPVPR